MLAQFDVLTIFFFNVKIPNLIRRSVSKEVFKLFLQYSFSSSLRDLSCMHGTELNFELTWCNLNDFTIVVLTLAAINYRSCRKLSLTSPTKISPQSIWFLLFFLWICKILTLYTFEWSSWNMWSLTGFLLVPKRFKSSTLLHLILAQSSNDLAVWFKQTYLPNLWMRGFKQLASGYIRINRRIYSRFRQVQRKWIIFWSLTVFTEWKKQLLFSNYVKKQIYAANWDKDKREMIISYHWSVLLWRSLLWDIFKILFKVQTWLVYKSYS